MGNNFNSDRVKNSVGVKSTKPPTPTTTKSEHFLTKMMRNISNGFHWQKREKQLLFHKLKV